MTLVIYLPESQAELKLNPPYEFVIDVSPTSLIYDFVLFKDWSRFEKYAKQSGIHVLKSNVEVGGSIAVRASFPDGSLRRFQQGFPAGWFRRVS